MKTIKYYLYLDHHRVAHFFQAKCEFLGTQSIKHFEFRNKACTVKLPKFKRVYFICESSINSYVGR